MRGVSGVLGGAGDKNLNYYLPSAGDNNYYRRRYYGDGIVDCIGIHDKNNIIKKVQFLDYIEGHSLGKSTRLRYPSASIVP